MGISEILLFIGLFFVIQWAIKRFSLKSQDILLLASFAFIVHWGLNVFVDKPRKEEESTVEVVPANKEIDFVDGVDQQEKLTEVLMPYARFVFSNHGASLRVAEFRRERDGEVKKLQTMMPLNEYEKEQSPFLVALNEQTPFNYELTGRDEGVEKTILTYQAKSNAATIKKEFVIHRDIHKIDLLITIDPRGNKSIQPRLFFVAPYISESGKNEQIAGVVQELHQSVTQYMKSRSARTLADEIWTQPTLFGAQDRYFVTALVNDAHNFAMRGYFKVGDDVIYPILEGPTIEKETTWNLSFYVGPKEQAVMDAVDGRLDSLLNYGMFSFLAKPMLKFLKWLNGYTHNFGWAIVLLTLLLRLLMLPFTSRGHKTQKKMAALRKKEEYLKRKYQNDPQALEKERVKLVQEQLGSMAGCLPMLLQFPIFWALLGVLRTSIELYKVPFLWISDLSMPDPFYILPAITFLSMILMPNTSGDASGKMMMLAMAAIFGAASTNFASGVVLYIAISSLAGAVQAHVQNSFKKKDGMRHG